MHIGIKQSTKVKPLGSKIMFPNLTLGNKYQPRNPIISSVLPEKSDIFKNVSNSQHNVYIPVGLKDQRHKKKSHLEK